MQLYTGKLITYEEALRQSSNPDDFALKVSGISSTSNASWDQFAKEEQEEAPAEDGDLKIEKF
jgi:twitching motility protein PilT